MTLLVSTCNSTITAMMIQFLQMRTKEKIPTKNSIEKEVESCPTICMATTVQLLQPVYNHTPAHIPLEDISVILLLLLCIHTDTVTNLRETHTCFQAMHSTRLCGLIQHQVRPTLVNHPTCTPMHNRTGTTVADHFRIRIVIIHMAPITILIATMCFSMVQT